MANLAEFMDRYTGQVVDRYDQLGFWRLVRPRVSGRLGDAGPDYERIIAAAPSLEMAEQLLASLFWWCYVRTRQFQEDTFGILRQDQHQIVVPHDGGTALDLLILTSRFGEPASIRVTRFSPARSLNAQPGP